jgi:hypothetical protein
VLQRAHTGLIVSFTADSRRHRAHAHVPILIVSQAESTRCPQRLMHEQASPMEPVPKGRLRGR